ncbi:MAG: ABC transporter permease subunit [Chloroflexi bacterium]|nr:MAG: ABC transporter permease subunit [Chloroflexota bacterium]
MVAVGIFVFGVLGGLALTASEVLDSGFLATFGNALGTIGDIIELTIVGVGGLVGAVMLSSFSANLVQHTLKDLRGIESHVAGFVLGGVMGAVILGLVALFGTQGALLGLFAPVVTAILGAQAAAALYTYVFNVDKRAFNVTKTQATGRLIASIVGAVIMFVIAAEMLDLSRALVQGRLPAEDTFRFFGVAFPVRSFIGKAMLMGAILSGIMGALSGVHESIPVGMTIYNGSRTILNAMRSIEPLIMGIVFVIWVGVGPFAGVLALGLHSIAALGKLYSEQIENIDNGPLEAIQSTGATRLQTIIYGVVPQIIPPYIAFTLYRWDINVRMSTIIGFVGGGGIGFILQQQINLLQYRDAGVAMLAIAIVVSVLDYMSATIRERII